MTDELDNFMKSVREMATNNKGHNSREDRKTVAGWVKQLWENSDERCIEARRDRYVTSSELGESDVEPPEDTSILVDRPVCTRDLRAATSRRAAQVFREGQCPRKDVLAKLAPTTDEAGIGEVIEQIANGEITTAAQFIFSVSPYVRDGGDLFRETLEKELMFFRDIVEDTVDRRVQDEADVMMHTQNSIKNKFKHLTSTMTQRTFRIRQRLYEISPKFNWLADGRDKHKVSRLINGSTPVTPKRNKSSEGPNIGDKLTHTVFMRGQWLKKELARLHEENKNLRSFLDKFSKLADERKAQESQVPRMLLEQKEEFELELDALRKTFNINLEIIDALYIEHHRCVKPLGETCAAGVAINDK